jgi:hypothetical protein
MNERPSSVSTRAVVGAIDAQLPQRVTEALLVRRALIGQDREEAHGAELAVVRERTDTRSSRSRR